MLDFDDLSDLHEELPGIGTVKLYPLGENSVRGAAITVSAAETRPLDAQSRDLAGIEVEAESCRFHLWTSTFSKMRTATIRRGWLIEEPNGSQWIVMSARLEMMRTRWACDCVRNFGEPDD